MGTAESPQCNHECDQKDFHVAIVGASYSGLSLANKLHLKSIPYTIVDRRSIPFTHVMGGSGFNLPCFPSVASKLELKCKNDGFLNKLTRKEVLDLLLSRVQNHLIPENNVVEIIKDETSGFYLLTETKSNDTAIQRNEHRYGPYQCIIGADGVVSKCRTSGLRGVFLIGDARWVNERFYDLGLRRIDQGADIALTDGLKLGEAICKSLDLSSNVQDVVSVVNDETNNAFCAKAIHNKKITRQFFFIAILLALICWKNNPIINSF